MISIPDYGVTPFGFKNRDKIYKYFKNLKSKGVLEKSKHIFSRLKRLLQTLIKKYLASRIYSNYSDFKKIKDYLES